MSRKRELHKIDNYLVALGWIILVVSLTAAALLPHSGTVDAIELDTYGGGLFWSFAGACMLLAIGYFLRARENKALIIWDILERHTEVDARDLAVSTGFDGDDLQRAL